MYLYFLIYEVWFMYETEKTMKMELTNHSQKLPSLSKMSPVKIPQVHLAAYKRYNDDIQ